MGGKAFKNITRRIKKDEIESTLLWLEEKWPDFKLNGAPLSDCLLGSAGKNEDSGDIDLNLGISLYDQDLVARQLVSFLGEDLVQARPGHNQIFTAIPISGNTDNGYVQVDFMFGDRAWQAFSYFSPAMSKEQVRNFYKPKASQFKGLYRTEFLKALTAYNSDWVLEENGEMIARVGPTFFHDRGLVWRYRYRPFKQNNSGERIKTFKEVTKEEFLEIFPSAITARTDYIMDPKKVTLLLFDKHVTPDDCQTLESCWTYTTWNYSPDERAKIVEIYLERLNSLKAEIPIAQFKKIGIKVSECAGVKS